MRITYKSNDTVQVFRLGKTTNKKISDGKSKMVQSYTFSKEQFDYINNCLENSVKPVFKTFFSLDSKNCFDCPFSINTGGGGCYTHKVMQYSGFVSMLKSIVNEFGNYDNLPNYSTDIVNSIVKMSKDKYVRFGTYGEPSLHPLELVSSVSAVSSTWTGYTHQYFRKPEYGAYFMASTHNKAQANKASEKFGYRSFIAVKDNNKGLGVICPASNESGKKSNCADCGLCSGVKGKGKKDVVILEH